MDNRGKSIQQKAIHRINENWQTSRQTDQERKHKLSKFKEKLSLKIL